MKAVIALSRFGDWLYEERRKARLSQDELALRAGISKNYVSVLERDLPNYKTGALPQPTREKVTALALGLGVPVSEALRAAGFMPAELTYEPVEEELEIISAYRGVPPNLRPVVLAQIKAFQAVREAQEPVIGKRARKAKTEEEGEEEGETGE